MRRNLVPRYLVLSLGYGGLVLLAGMLALLLRWDGTVPPEVWEAWLGLAPWFTALSLVGFLIAGLFHGLWRFAGTVTLFQVFKGVTLSAIGLVALLVLNPHPPFTLGFVILVWACELAMVGGARIGWRLWREGALSPPGPAGAVTRALVVGVGQAGVHLIQEMRRGPAGRSPLSPAGFIDADPRLTGKQIEGVRVLGTLAVLPRVLERRIADLVVISDPALPAATMREIVRECERAGVRVRTLPGLADPGRATSAIARLRDVSLEDLLGRRAVQLDLAEIRAFLRGQRVLVTGAGGSIGSELARQAAEFAPAAVALLDRAENGLYYLDQELRARHPRLELEACVADVGDPQGLEAVLARFRPTVVLHAAAHKHVPLLEAHPREAVLNNVVGTRLLVEAAERHDVAKLVLVSTDKAVRPSSVMGASKRVCEMLLQARARRSRTRFVAVRFGNVLGSEGSVVPLFQRQIERGGPLTVTDPEARRYFMTVTEAARLVLQAGAMGEGGEVFLLDMGEQVRILDLARQLVRMAGLREGVDIEIVFIGLRPGEKLFEELHTASERARMTRHERIVKWETDPIDEPRLLAGVRDLEAAAEKNDDAAIRRLLGELVLEYQPAQDQALTRGPAAPGDRTPGAPPVELPVGADAGARAGATVAGARDREADRGGSASAVVHEGARRVTDAALAAVLLAISSPLWALVWLEACRGPRGSRAGRGGWLDERVCVVNSHLGGRSRGGGPSGASGIESRAPGPAGARIRCARFRSDLGPVSRGLGRRGLDRLPLLRNVLRGQLALVGPSPTPEDSLARAIEVAPDFVRRFAVPSGVTGLAQLSRVSSEDPAGLARRAALDLKYVAQRSRWLDVAILLRTAGFILVPPAPARPVARPAQAGASDLEIRRGRDAG